MRPDPALEARYRALFARYLIAQDALVREDALEEATEVGKTALQEGPALDRMYELHRRTQRAMAEAWRAGDAPVEQAAAYRRLADGDATSLMLALVMPHELALYAHHEQRWRREHETLGAMFEQTGDLIMILDGDGLVDDVNPAFSRATGWSRVEASMQPAVQWQGPLPRVATQQVQTSHVTRDGGSIQVEWSVSPIFGRDGSLLSHVCIGRDVTRARQIEDSLRENDKLRAAATLAGGIAHDFNNLLGSVLGLAEICELDAAAGSRQARNLARIREAGGKAALLVRQMLDFSRQTPKTLSDMTVGELLAHVHGLLRTALPTQLSLAVVLEDDSPLCIDLVQIEQVLMNVTRNAGQAMGTAGGEVRLVADRVDAAGVRCAADARDARWARLRIIDTGAGMPPEVMAKIFEPFFTTKPVGEGTGLGLSAAHGIVANHGGRIEVDSEAGRGTTFGIFLPIASTDGAPADGRRQESGGDVE